MREIKFRVWDEEEGVMISPDSITRDGVAMWKCHGAWSTSKNLEQYTGLKDKNGTEIYEGDVLRCVDGDGLVEFAEGNFRFESEGRWFPLFVFSDGDNGGFEVIGNIHENPELLEA